jgi:hypothetical protein
MADMLVSDMTCLCLCEIFYYMRFSSLKERELCVLIPCNKYVCLCMGFVTVLYLMWLFRFTLFCLDSFCWVVLAQKLPR